MLLNEEKTKNNKNVSIMVLRVAAMIMIILCHLSNWWPFPFNLGQLFNIGVPIFLFISGYLYGKKEEFPHYLKWLRQRYLRINIPLFIFMLFLSIITVILGTKVNFIKLSFACLFDLYGISFLFTNIQAYTINGMGHLWFITSIMLMYLITPLIAKVNYQKVNKPVMILIILTIAFLLALIHISITYLVIYFIGFVFSRCNFENKLNIKKIIIMTMLFILDIGLWIISRSLFDGTILYDNFIIALVKGYIVLLTFFILSNFNKLSKCLNASRFLVYLDGVSFYIYIVHFMFGDGPFYLNSFVSNKFVATIVFLVLSLLFGTLLMVVDKKIQSALKKIHIT